MNERWIRRINMFWVFFWALLFLVVAGLLLWVLLSGNRVDNEKEPEMSKIESLNCESDEMLYPLFLFDDSKAKNLKILITYKNDEVKTVSLKYVLFYDDEEMVRKSEAINHGAMNEEFGRDRLVPDSYSATYASFVDKLNFSIFASEEDLNEVAKKYFMLDEVSSYEIAKVREKYDTIGLNCIEK